MYKNIGMEASTLNHCKSVARALSLPATLSGCVLIVLNESSQAKVGDLAHQIVSNKDVGCSQVTVDVVHSLDVRHSRRNLQ